MASDLRREGYAGRTLVLKLRDSRFRTMSKQRTLPAPTNATTVIYEAALALLAELHEPGRLLRLIGLTLTGLTEEAHQAALDESRRDRACDEAVDKVRARYGQQALRRGSCDPGSYRDQARLARGRENPGDEPDAD